uniref:PAS domain-containing protein n=1 Tax=Phenylobacterium glaciei TaxID=2803784 RepID=A0A974S8P2_9CAUL|nr:PAS domain-containing protein [Phenylobacterium glaciei]
MTSTVSTATRRPDLAGVLAIYHPEDAALLARMVDEAVREGTNYALQARIYRPDGSLRHVVARGAAERGPGRGHWPLRNLYRCHLPEAGRR